MTAPNPGATYMPGPAGQRQASARRIRIVLTPQTLYGHSAAVIAQAQAEAAARPPPGHALTNLPSTDLPGHGAASYKHHKFQAAIIHTHDGPIKDHDIVTLEQVQLLIQHALGVVHVAIEAEDARFKTDLDAAIEERAAQLKRDYELRIDHLNARLRKLEIEVPKQHDQIEGLTGSNDVRRASCVAERS